MNFEFIGNVLRTLPTREKFFVAFTLMIRLGLVILDLLGIFLIGAVVALLSGTKVSEQSAFGQLLQIFSTLGLKNGYAGVLAVALVFFIAKGIVSALVISVTGNHLAKLEATKSSEAFGALVEANLDTVNESSDQDLIYSTTDSVNSATTSAVLTGSTILSESALLIAISTYLAIADFWLFVLMCSFFGVVGLFMNKFVASSSAREARNMHVSNLQSKLLVQDSLNNFRQVAVSPNRTTLSELFYSQRLAYAQAKAKFQTINGLPRYITEIAVLLGVSILVLQRAMGGIDSTSAPIISMFLVGIFRIVSSMLPLQSALSGWKHLKFEASGALRWLELSNQNTSGGAKVTAANGAPISVDVQNLTYRFPGQIENALVNLTLSVDRGAFIALVGASGSGKSTLADCILGLREPDSGLVLIDGIESRRFLKEFPGRMAYVPQDTPVFAASVRSNVTLNFGAGSEGEAQRARTVMKQAGLDQFASFDFDLEMPIGEGSLGLSGGEAQRLAIARALFTSPGLIVLDEATSALDAETQEKVQETLLSLRGKVTLVVIAHRKETIENADRVLEINSGELVEQRKDK